MGDEGCHTANQETMSNPPNLRKRLKTTNNLPSTPPRELRT